MIRSTLSVARLVPRLVGGVIHVAESSVRTALGQARRMLPGDEAAGPGISPRPMASLAPDIESPALASQPAISRVQAPAPPAVNGVAVKPAEDPSVEEMGLPSTEAPLLDGHVSEEPRLVAESADPGAAGGAGATLHVSEPWSGYREQRATDVIDRLGSEELGVLAVVTLFEQFNRRRSSVLKAVERELARRERAPGVQ